MTDCINLKERFGKVYRIKHDEAVQERAERKDPWMMIITCKWGIIYPQGGTKLAAEVDRHPTAARALQKMAGVEQTQEGDLELENTFVFDVSLFDQVGEVLKPKRRRVLTAEHKAKAVAALALAKRQAETTAKVA